MQMQMQGGKFTQPFVLVELHPAPVAAPIAPSLLPLQMALAAGENMRQLFVAGYQTCFAVTCWWRLPLVAPFMPFAQSSARMEDPEQ